MDVLLSQIKINVNESVYLKDPETSALGKSIVSESIRLIHDLGFEQFTMRKLADAIGSPESSVYRYFENKHKLLLYLTSWYWVWLEYRLVFSIANIPTPEQQLIQAFRVLAERPEQGAAFGNINLHNLYKIVVEEAPKTYLNREVDIENQLGVFLVYKRICARLVDIVGQINPHYPNPKTLISMMMDAIHRQQFYAEHLPGLCDADTNEKLRHIASTLIINTLKSE